MLHLGVTCITHSLKSARFNNLVILFHVNYTGRTLVFSAYNELFVTLCGHCLLHKTVCLWETKKNNLITVLNQTYYCCRRSGKYQLMLLLFRLVGHVSKHKHKHTQNNGFTAHRLTYCAKPGLSLFCGRLATRLHPLKLTPPFQLHRRDLYNHS